MLCTNLPPTRYRWTMFTHRLDESWAFTRWLPEERLVACRSIRYTQNSCSDVFACGTPLHETIYGIITNKIDTRTADYLVLDVVCMNGNMYSVDNRRLFCMREAEDLLFGQSIFTRVRVYDFASMLEMYAKHPQYVESSPVSSILERFLAHYTTVNAGENIDVRWRGCDI